MNMNVHAKLIGLLLLGVILASACTQTYSQAPLGTPTLISTGLFVSPFPSGQDPLQIVANLGTETAMAKTEIAGGTTTPGTPGTPMTATATATGPSLTPTIGTPIIVVVTTPVPVTVNPGVTITPRLTVIVPTISSTRPGSYTLHEGEFPYCIARRFNVNPDDLLSANGITDGGIFYPGRTLTIPQTGSWPGDPALHNHPDTYTVDTSTTTIYGVACYYGNVYPESIASANNLALSTTLTIGQRLAIP
jgi:LysM repeat protein